MGRYILNGSTRNECKSNSKFKYTVHAKNKMADLEIGI